MNDQEMQFADPDWKPTRPLNTNKAAQEQETDTPQPINSGSQEQQQWQAPPPIRDYQDGYAGPGQQMPPEQKLEYPNTDSSYQYVPPNNASGIPYRQQARRRGRSPWLWIIIAIIILGFMSGGFGKAFQGFGPQKSVTETQTFTVSNLPTIIIDDLNGNVHVQSSGSSGSVNVQAIKQTDSLGNPNNENVKYAPSPDGNTITISFDGQGGSVDFNVTVPDSSNLQLQTSSGDVSVEGINGQISMSTDSGNITAANDSFSNSASLTTGSGDITATNDTFSGSSKLGTGSGDITARQDHLAGPATLQTDSGGITFEGDITGSGNYQFTSGSGDINTTFSGNTALVVNASTDNGTITSNIPTVSAQNNDSGGTASGYVGSSSSSAQLTLKTNDGDIHVNTQP